MTKIITFLKGKKTYIVAGLLSLYGLLDLVTGDISLTQFLNNADFIIFMNGVGFAALRAAISKVIDFLAKYIQLTSKNES